MKYAHYDEATGKIIGWYDSEIHQSIPTPNVEADENIWMDAITRGCNHVDQSSMEFSVMDFRTEEEKLSDAKTQKRLSVEGAFNSEVDGISHVLPHEMASWRKQEEEARAYVIDGSTPTPFIDSLHAARAGAGVVETKDDLVGKIIANADAYAVAYSSILGKYQGLMKAIAAATTVEEVEAIQW